MNCRWGSAAAAVVGLTLLVGCGSAGQVPGTPATTVTTSVATECAQSAPMPASDPDLLQAIHLDLDGYYRPFYRSEPTPV